MDIPAEEAYCYLTTVGRTSREPREIEIWYGLIGSTLYMLSGSGAGERGPKAHWVSNLLKTPSVTVRIADTTYQGEAAVLERETPEDSAARALLVAKYQKGYSGDLANWGKTAITLAVALR